MKIAVFLPNWIGDTVMATPALRGLRTLAGGGQLVGVMRPYVSEVLEGLDLFDQQVLFSPKSKHSELKTGRAIAHLKSLDVDMTVNLTGSLRTAWMAWRSGARRRVGAARDLGRMLLTDVVEHSKQHMLAVSQVDRFIEIAAAAGCRDLTPQLVLATTPADEEAADAVWNRLGLPAGDNVVVFNGGSAGGSAKHWPVTHFAALAQQVVSKLGMSVLVNCGPSERDSARDIVRLAGSPHVTSLADFELPIGLSKAVIRRSRLLVTTDSGPRFFGVAFNRPVVALFGSTPPEMTATQSPLETQLALGLDCQPCMKRTCPLGHHQCMTNLTADRVMSDIERALENERRSASAA